MILERKQEALEARLTSLAANPSAIGRLSRVWDFSQGADREAKHDLGKEALGRQNTSAIGIGTSRDCFSSGASSRYKGFYLDCG